MKLTVKYRYFLWDTLDASVNFADLGFVIHGAACLMIYTFAFVGNFHSYFFPSQSFRNHFLPITHLDSFCGRRMDILPTVALVDSFRSTIFLNIHWFLDKTNRAGSTLQLINGFFLVGSFFAVRLVYGGIMVRSFPTSCDSLNQSSRMTFGKHYMESGKSYL
jgi:hypothetical protein